jgi:endonuclease YncB( thermonuclease family)
MGKTLDATVVKVADGDTATVRIKVLGSKVKVRFYGVILPNLNGKGIGLNKLIVLKRGSLQFQN